LHLGANFSGLPLGKILARRTGDNYCAAPCGLLAQGCAARNAEHLSPARPLGTALRCNRRINEEGMQLRHDGRALADRCADALD
jgi:hypothetical protein